mmetsp:Transcript_12246/g.16018  ORF Transcript_12246/g.16018 Transcript_12246/m.16018 type:complete len:216 (-) Transcript_12246:80-727(-)
MLVDSIDNSNHSTFAVAHATVNKPQPLHLDKKSRAIAFDEDANEYFDNTMRCFEDCAETWFEKKDYNNFRVNRRETIQKALNEQKCKEQTSVSNASFSKVIRALYTATSSVAYVLNDVSQALSDKQKEQISQLYGNDESLLELIGLEYQVVVEIKKEAQTKREDLQDVVYDVQLEHKRGMWNDVEVQDELRDSCLNFTQSSGLFAQLLALAQQEQ